MIIIDSKDFAWNEFEQKMFNNENYEMPSKYKIKIVDLLEKRIQLEKILYKLPQKDLARWAIKNAESYIKYIDIGDVKLKDSILNETIETFNKRISGKINTYSLRKAGFLANKLAKLSQSDLSKYSARVFAQSIATAHMRGHAIVASDYSIKVINLLFPGDIPKVEKERNSQIKLANSILNEHKS